MSATAEDVQATGLRVFEASPKKGVWKSALPFGAMALFWIWALLGHAHIFELPQANPTGLDFAHNMAGAYVMDHGGNPYNGAALIRGERAYLASHGLAGRLPPTSHPTTWVGYPPLFLWLLIPLLKLSFPVVAAGWILATTGLLVLCATLCPWFLGWSVRAAPVLLFLTTPQTTLQIYYGNPANLVLGVIIGGLAIHRRWPVAAGLLLSLTWLKPQLGLPSLLLIVLFSRDAARHIVGGFVGGTVALLVFTMLGPGPHSLMLWVRGMMSVSNMAGEQPNMIPLVGLYAGWASHSVHTVLELLTVVVALGLTGWWWWRTRSLPEVPFHLVAWLWPVWLLALPYAHFPDEMLLFPAVLAVLGHNGRKITQAGPALCVYLLYLSAPLYNVAIHHVQLLSLPLACVAVLLYRGAVSSLSRDNAHKEQPEWMRHASSANLTVVPLEGVGLLHRGDPKSWARAVAGARMAAAMQDPTDDAQVRR